MRGLKDLSLFFRHPSAHEYYDPNDYIGDIHQEMDREELELEVRRASHFGGHSGEARRSPKLLSAAHVSVWDVDEEYRKQKHPDHSCKRHSWCWAVFSLLLLEQFTSQVTHAEK